MTVGYSGRPLSAKLGIKPGLEIAFVAEGAPADLPDRVDLLVFTVTSRAHLERTLPDLLPRMSRDGALWLSWPKKTSRLPTDVDEHVAREVILPTGWVDVKVVAMDERWTGVKFVLRKHLR